ncbi:MAG: Flp family type IVb pilin [Actinomycetota bacterium]
MMWLTAMYFRFFTPREHEGKDVGATMVEYALMVTLIAVACVVAVTALGGSISDAFTEITSNL